MRSASLLLILALASPSETFGSPRQPRFEANRFIDIAQFLLDHPDRGIYLKDPCRRTLRSHLVGFARRLARPPAGLPSSRRFLLAVGENAANFFGWTTSAPDIGEFRNAKRRFNDALLPEADYPFHEASLLLGLESPETPPKPRSWLEAYGFRGALSVPVDAPYIYALLATLLPLEWHALSMTQVAIFLDLDEHIRRADLNGLRDRLTQNLDDAVETIANRLILFHTHFGSTVHKLSYRGLTEEEADLLKGQLLGNEDKPHDFIRNHILPLLLNGFSPGEKTQVLALVEAYLATQGKSFPNLSLWGTADYRAYATDRERHRIVFSKILGHRLRSVRARAKEIHLN